MRFESFWIWGTLTADCMNWKRGETRSTISGFARRSHFGGAPYELAESSGQLYAKRGLPVVKSWKTTLPVAAAAQ
jgi:hypothetical protein